MSIAAPTQTLPRRVDAVVKPLGSLEVLSQREVNDLVARRDSATYETFRRCALAVLNCGSAVDNADAVFREFHDFDIDIEQEQGGLKLKLRKAPESAFVDGELIRGIREHLYSVLRDILFVHRHGEFGELLDFKNSAGITEAVFSICRNARVLRTVDAAPMVVCWGGHSISRDEYDYTKEVGYELGLRGVDICTGCGPGAMKGPMKGATIGHAKQRISRGRYLGLTEPGIIAAEAPNPIVNHLVILPDMEKRLEAFTRIGHAFIVFPGGVGTAEEVLYLLGIMLQPDNADLLTPVFLTGPESSREYFETLREFVGMTLGAEYAARLPLVVADPVEVARRVQAAVEDVLLERKETGDAEFFNWRLSVPPQYQQPFMASHESMLALDLTSASPSHVLAAELRRAFTGIVAGNVKEDGVRAVASHGRFKLQADARIAQALDRLLTAFVEQGRMRLPGKHYEPCYEVVSKAAT